MNTQDDELAAISTKEQLIIPISSLILYLCMFTQVISFAETAANSRNLICPVMFFATPIGKHELFTVLRYTAPKLFLVQIIVY